jgi:hypothetical protein
VGSGSNQVQKNFIFTEPWTGLRSGSPKFGVRTLIQDRTTASLPVTQKYEMGVKLVQKGQVPVNTRPYLYSTRRSVHRSHKDKRV